MTMCSAIQWSSHQFVVSMWSAKYAHLTRQMLIGLTQEGSGCYIDDIDICLVVKTITGLVQYYVRVMTAWKRITGRIKSVDELWISSFHCINVRRASNIPQNTISVSALMSCSTISPSSYTNKASTNWQYDCEKSEERWTSHQAMVLWKASFMGLDFWIVWEEPVHICHQLGYVH